MKISTVEGELQAVSAPTDYIHRNTGQDYAIVLRHHTYGLGRALANTFSPSDEIVIARKTDFNAMLERVEYLERVLKEDKPWLTKKS